MKFLTGFAKAHGLSLDYLRYGDTVRNEPHPSQGGIDEKSIHQAVLDAVDLLSLEGQVDAQQLAKAVVKLCQRTTQSPNAGGMIQSNVIKGDRVEMKVGINHGQVVEGNVTNHGAMNIGQGKGSGSKT